MKSKQIFLVLFLVNILISCNNKTVEKIAVENIQIIPEPAETNLKDGFFEFNSETTFVVLNAEEKEIFSLLTTKFKTATGFSPTIKNEIPQSNYVALKTDTALSDEAYELEVNSNNILVTANGLNGFLYGIQTLNQLLPPEFESAKKQDFKTP